MNKHREIPHNIEAEQSVLCAMMIKREAAATAIDRLVSDDFYREDNRQIFMVMKELYDNNMNIEIITLVEALKKKNLLDKIGGITAVTYLANIVPTAAYIEQHIEIVHEKAMLRYLINTATMILDKAYGGMDAAEDILDYSEKELLRLSVGDGAKHFMPLSDVIVATFEAIEKRYETKGQITGLSTGFRALDNMTAGLQRSDFILLAARPSMGKTALAINIATYAATQGNTVAFFSLEMSSTQLMERIFAANSLVDSRHLRTGNISDIEWDKICEGLTVLGDASLYIDDTVNITVGEIRSKTRRLKAMGRLDFIVIDYLQLMQTKSNTDNRQIELTEISRSLKALARELEVPLLALSQLNRSVESRQVKRPMLSDLRESGALEQDADLVMMLYREDYYDPDSDNKNITEVIFAKHRNGPVGVVNLYFQKECAIFKDLVIKE